jgi:hypothetical protein
VTSHLKLTTRVVLVSLALLAASAHHAAPASAATPCWKSLLNDWYDGRIDKTYAVHCYNDALKHLPADVQTYSSAHEDILRALQSAVAKARKAGKDVGPNTLIPGAPGAGPTAGKGPTVTNGRDRNKGLTGIADRLNPGSASSLPLPLLILGGLALLLVAAGGAGLVAKRVQARRPGP